jgi:hypothetical protein
VLSGTGINDVRYVNLPGQTWAWLPRPDGPVFATSYDGTNLPATVLTA